jgi:hypothetical protein
MEQNKKPVDKFFYSEKEWDRLGCGPLPEERDRNQLQDAHSLKDVHYKRSRYLF